MSGGGENYWKLAQHDEFNDRTSLENWSAEHEVDNCHGNFIDQISCNHEKNVALKQGYLILEAHHENYANFKYTSAQVTSKSTFSYGRLEVRLAQPVGSHIRTSVFTFNRNDTYWHENGQIDVASKVQEKYLYRGVHFANSRDQYEAVNYEG